VREREERESTPIGACARALHLFYPLVAHFFFPQTKSYYRDAHGLVFVVDAADQTRWEEARAALEDAVRHPDLAGAPLLVVANKSDALPTAAAAADDVATAMGPAAADGPPGGPGGLVVSGAARPAGGGAALGHALAWLVARARRGRRADALRARPAPT